MRTVLSYVAMDPPNGAPKKKGSESTPVVLCTWWMQNFSHPGGVGSARQVALTNPELVAGFIAWQQAHPLPPPRPHTTDQQSNLQGSEARLAALASMIQEGKKERNRIQISDIRVQEASKREKKDDQ